METNDQSSHHELPSKKNNSFLLILYGLILITFFFTFGYCIAVLNTLQCNSDFDKCTIGGKFYKAMLEMQKLQNKVFDDSIITFLITLIIILLAGFVINQLDKITKYKDEIDKDQRKISLDKINIDNYQKGIKKEKEEIAGFTNKLQELSNSLSKTGNEMEGMKLISSLLPNILSIYMLSNLPTDNENITFTDNDKKNGTINSICFKIERHIKANELNLKKLIQIGNIDKENKNIFINYLNDSMYNLESYMQQHKLNSDYAQNTINNIWNIRNQINDLKTSPP